MHSVKFDICNTVFTKPEDMTDEECTPLNAYRSEPSDPNHPFVLTAWMPNVDDLKALNEGKPIWIKTAGHGFVPMAMFTMKNETESNEDL